MHELSIALSIIDLAEEETRRQNGSSILELELELGPFSGVEHEGLKFALETIVTDTMLQQAIIRFVETTAESVCKDCMHSFQPNSLYAPCLHCGSHRTTLVKGNELRIKSILIDTE